MIDVPPGAALFLVGVIVVGAAGWGSFVSVRTAASGPRWALAHLGKARLPTGLAAALGVGALLLARPIWLGLVAVYVPVAVLAIIALLYRSLVRLGSLGGLDPIAPDVFAPVLLRARRALVVAGGVLVGMGGVGLVYDIGPVSWIVVAVGATVAVNGLAIQA